jgi:hypothetical protein
VKHGRQGRGEHFLEWFWANFAILQQSKHSPGNEQGRCPHVTVTPDPCLHPVCSQYLLLSDQEHYAKYEPTILELKRKYETAMKEKMLVSLEKDKV